MEVAVKLERACKTPTSISQISAVSLCRVLRQFKLSRKIAAPLLRHFKLSREIAAPVLRQFKLSRKNAAPIQIQ